MFSASPFLSDPILSHALARTVADNPALADITLEILGILLKLRIPPNLIFGFIKTGFLATEQNVDSLSLDDTLEWLQSQFEYFALTAKTVN